MPDLLFKICSEAEWRAALGHGRFDGSEADRRDGYIHLSDAGQVAETAARHFAGQADLVLVAVDPARLGGELRWEKSRRGALFPHLYAPLPVEAAIWVEPLPLAQGGGHLFPALAR